MESVREKVVHPEYAYSLVPISRIQRIDSMIMASQNVKVPLSDIIIPSLREIWIAINSYSNDLLL